MKNSLVHLVRSEDRYLSIQEAADIFGLTATTLRRWEKTEVFLPYDRTEGNHRRYRLSDVLYFKRKREIKKKKIKVEEFPVKLEEDYGIKRNDRQKSVIIRETKVFQILIENNMNRPMILIIILGWMLSMVVNLINHLELIGLQPYATRLLTDYKNSVAKFEDDIELKELEIMKNKPLNTKAKPRYQNSKWKSTRENSGKIFQHLIKTSYNNAIDEEERERAKELCEKIIKPFQKLTAYLSDYSPGNYKYDVAKLLLTKKPEDYGYMRVNWSARLLSKVCIKFENTKSASKSQIGRLFKEVKWNCTPKRKIFSPDPEYGTKIKKIAKIMNSLNKNDMILFEDEFKFTSTKINARLEPSYHPDGLQYIFPKGNLRNDSLKNYSPTTSIQVTGLFNPVTKSLAIIEIKKNSFAMFYEGLTKLLTHFYDYKGGSIYVVLDNASYHGKKILQDQLDLEFNGRIKVIWLPVYSPNNNPIEKIWDELLSSVDRECNNKNDLREALKQSMVNYSSNKSNKDPNLTLKCFTCNKKWEFREDNREDNDKSIEKHICFSIPLINPYSIHALTHSQEDFNLGQ